MYLHQELSTGNIRLFSSLIADTRNTSPRYRPTRSKMDAILAQNIDILNYILSFLVDDGNSVVKFALSSKELYNRIIHEEDSNHDLWKTMILHRWKRTIGRPSMFVEDGGAEDRTMPISYRDLYIEKRRADADAILRLNQIVTVLQSMLKLSETQGMISDQCVHLGRAWEHRDWNTLLRNRADCYDIFKSIARRHLGSSSSSVRDKVMAFLAARCVQDIHFVDCLLEWKRQLENGVEEPQSRTQSSQLKSVQLLEKFVFLICEMQRNPCELIQDDNNLSTFDEDVESSHANATPAKKSLDEIAKLCNDRIDKELGRDASVRSKLEVVNDVLVNQYGFSGNVEDYYNHQNVLLDRVLQSKSGMPLTLCILYSCVCRRIGIPVQVTGLPGHIVLGFDTNDTNVTSERRSFIDVFHGCRFLTSDDCRGIVAQYGIPWQEDFLAPLSTKMTLQRIFNNLRNCHEKSMMRAEPPMFCSDLMFQAHTLSMVHRYPPEIAATMLERVTVDLAIGLSPDLLRAYKLLSPRGLQRDPVVNATHARALLELSSYVGLAYHNYAR